MSFVDTRAQNGLAWVKAITPQVNATSTAVRQRALDAGCRVAMIERDQNGVRARIHGLIAGADKRGKADQATHGAQIAAFKAGVGYGSSRGADLAFAAAFEDAAVNRAAFAGLAKVISRAAIIATNTSHLGPRDVLDGMDTPSRRAGLHFFSPAHLMKRLDIGNLPETSKHALATAFALAMRLRKGAAVPGIGHGFNGNRMLAARRRAGSSKAVPPPRSRICCALP